MKSFPSFLIPRRNLIKQSCSSICGRGMISYGCCSVVWMGGLSYLCRISFPCCQLAKFRLCRLCLRSCSFQVVGRILCFGNCNNFRCYLFCLYRVCGRYVCLQCSSCFPCTSSWLWVCSCRGFYVICLMRESVYLQYYGEKFTSHVGFYISAIRWVEPYYISWSFSSLGCS